MSKNKDKQDNIIKIQSDKIDKSINVDTAMYYINNINRLHNEYLSLLNDDVNISISMLYDHATYTGLLNYINQNLFSNNPYCIALSNRDINYKLDYDDIFLLDIIFSCYLKLNGRYKHKVLLSEFSLFIDLNVNAVSQWNSGHKRLSPQQFDCVQKWLKYAENEQIQSDTVKSMFILKSTYGYSEDVKPDTIISKQTASLPVADDYLLTDK